MYRCQIDSDTMDFPKWFYLVLTLDMGTLKQNHEQKTAFVEMPLYH